MGNTVKVEGEMKVLPEWLEAKVPEFVALERETSAAHSSALNIGICQLIAGAGFIMMIGTLMFHAAPPFFAGFGFALLIFGGGRWWFVSAGLTENYRKMEKISALFKEAGFHPPYNGEIKELSD
ncbi:hypothetical protein GOZ93_00880 [Agrobacterium vitis]|uniref:hypothetical protein n=1 Tax=Agrobacterium vitis TaxID=373 RepID=UPI0012E9332B|nr:hypothetical protein [Agrobacterium vitis]MUZ80792.1 hypothetical protein [Agrobacterium vitis]MVA33666.1 hypothetical protein [Agrobacterium vitis]